MDEDQAEVRLAEPPATEELPYATLDPDRSKPHWSETAAMAVKQLVSAGALFGLCSAAQSEEIGKSITAIIGALGVIGINALVVIHFVESRMLAKHQTTALLERKRAGTRANVTALLGCLFFAAAPAQDPRQSVFVPFVTPAQVGLLNVGTNRACRPQTGQQQQQTDPNVLAMLQSLANGQQQLISAHQSLGQQLTSQNQQLLTAMAAQQKPATTQTGPDPTTIALLQQMLSLQQQTLSAVQQNCRPCPSASATPPATTPNPSTPAAPPTSQTAPQGCPKQQQASPGPYVYVLPVYPQGAPQYQVPIGGVPQYQVPIGGPPQYQVPIGGIPQYQVPIGGMPQYAPPAAGAPQYRIPIGGAPQGQPPVSASPTPPPVQAPAPAPAPAPLAPNPSTPAPAPQMTPPQFQIPMSWPPRPPTVSDSHDAPRGYQRYY